MAKLKKFKTEMKIIRREAKDISIILKTSDWQGTSFNIHKVAVGGVPAIAADAKYMNKYDNQSGRGCWRHLYDPSTRGYIGIAKEMDSGSYKMMG